MQKQSYLDKPWLKVYKRDNIVTTLQPYPEIPLFQFLDDAASRYPKSKACVFLNRIITYEELAYDTNRFAKALFELGVKKGDLVGTLLPNCPQFIIADYAILKAGAANVPCSLLHTANDLEYELNSAEAETIICIDTHLELIKEIKPKTKLKNIIVTSLEEYAKERIIKPAPYGTLGFSELINEQEPNPPIIDINPKDDLAEVPFTGGATGVPKGVMLTHFNMTSNVLQTWGLLDRSNRLTEILKGAASVLLALPFFHQYGHWAMHSAVYNAWNMLLVPDPRDIDSIIELMQKWKPFMNIGVPTQYMRIVAKGIKKVGVLGASGSAALPPEVAEKYEKATGAPVDEGYGLTECSPVTHINLTGLVRILSREDKPVILPEWALDLIIKFANFIGKERFVRGLTSLIPLGTKLADRREKKAGKSIRKKGSIGVPLVDTDVKIVNEKGEEVPFGESGEMLIRGPQLMKGYWKEPGKGLDKEGFLHTGDIVRMDEDGFFYVVDRVKDMINVSGYKVYSRVVDDVLYQHPAVEMAAAIGIPDPEKPGSERVKAFIKLRENYKGKVKEEDIINFAREKLPPYAVPKLIEFRDELPLTVTEKIFKRKLREEELEKLKK